MPATDKTQTNTNGLDPDRAISDEKDDLLGRHPLAYRIADMINNLGDDYKDSVVIGIEGEWGSGKSSFINLILNKVRPSEDNLVIEFNPWNFSDQDELVKDFFTSMVDELKSKNKGLTRNITKYVSKLKMPDKIVVAPEVGGNSAGSLEWNLNDKPLKKQKDKIDKDLKKLKKRIVIVIEDIDRLDSNETKLIFKLVRLIADFPNTVFMLAYDRNRVGARLTENNIDGEEYLKKIIQLPFLIPKPAQAIYGELTRAIDAELKHRGFQEIDEERLLELISSEAFRGFFSTIRDIRRYTNSLRLDLKMLNPEELNPVDFVGVEAIRVFAPEVYLAMTNEKNAFTEARPVQFMTSSSEQEPRRTRIGRSIEKAPNGLGDSTKGIVYLLFPQAKGVNSGLGYTPLSEDEPYYTRAKRVCSRYMFDKYFSLSVPPMYISEQEMKEFVSETNVEALLEKLKEFSYQGRLRLASERLVDELEKLNDQQQENLIVSLLDSTECLKYDEQEDPGGINEFVNLAWGAVYDTLKRKGVMRVDFLTGLVNITKGFFTLTLFFDYLNGEMERSKAGMGGKPLLTEDELMLARKTYAEKIKAAAKDGSLMGSKKCGFTLIFWEQWGEKGEAGDYIAGLLRTDEGVLALLRGFVEEEVEMPPQEVSEGKIPKLDQSSRFSRFNRIYRKKIGILTDLADLDERVAKMDIRALSEENREVIELYKNPRERSGVARGEQHHPQLR